MYNNIVNNMSKTHFNYNDIQSNFIEYRFPEKIEWFGKIDIKDWMKFT